MKKRIIFTLVMIVGTICVFGLLSELLIRLLYDPAATLNLDKIAGNLENYVHTPPRNEMGFREDAVSNEVLQEDYKRILFLGDSFTQGAGVEKGEDRFSDIIENRLNLESQTSSLKYHIYNAGSDGTSPRWWVRFLKQLLPIYKPQYVFAIFFLRDGTDLYTSLLFYEKKIKDLKAKYENGFWYKYTYLGKYIGNKLTERKFSDYYLKNMINSYLGNETERKPWIREREYLLEIRNICESHGIGFYLVIFPMLHSLESDYQFHGVEKEISRFAEENNIPVFSLTSGFIGQESKALWVSPSDQHPNEKGHSIAADTLYPYLKKILER